ncbi:Flp family type IVb pilin [Bradyrhizobium erythrophlei]|uniref:Flp family type IVb pilin n=1 Tax=Bradyrhizobium erythrophlei TaxID=1437360 RepID=UPI0012AB5297|nr:Flp family type IVb pilin [Bradyrhizobium erythrophlei]
MRLFRAFLAAEAGGTGIEFTIIAAGVGLAMLVPLYLVGSMLSEKFEMIAAALKHQNN